VIAFKSLGRKGDIKMHCNLNALTLLDATYSKVRTLIQFVDDLSPR
jgi:hypothetical protein